MTQAVTLALLVLAVILIGALTALSSCPGRLERFFGREKLTGLVSATKSASASAPASVPAVGGSTSGPAASMPIYRSDEIDQKYEDALRCRAAALKGIYTERNGYYGTYEGEDCRADALRGIFTERVGQLNSYKDSQALSSSGLPTDVGVSVGPIGCNDCEEGYNAFEYNDGIPAEWRFPSTPINWTNGKITIRSDWYSDEGPAAYLPSGLPASVPDHDPLTS